MIVVEGPDGAGKTTLVTELCEKYGLTVGERGVTARSKLYEVTRSDTYRALGQELRGDSPPQIWDRLFFSEFVYAPIVGREVEFTANDIHIIRRVMSSIGCPVIMCLPDLETVKENITKDEQMDGVHENIEHIHHEYATMNLPLGTRNMWYDYTKPDITEGSGGRQTGSWVSKQRMFDGIEVYLEVRKEREF